MPAPAAVVELVEKFEQHIEVELNGNTSQGYKLVRMDIWRQGKVDLETKAGKRSIPFEYRERSELDVIPVENKS
jgi:hypothetical protein